MPNRTWLLLALSTAALGTSAAAQTSTASTSPKGIAEEKPLQIAVFELNPERDNVDFNLVSGTRFAPVLQDLPNLPT